MLALVLAQVRKGSTMPELKKILIALIIGTWCFSAHAQDDKGKKKNGSSTGSTGKKSPTEANHNRINKNFPDTTTVKDQCTIRLRLDEIDYTKDPE